MKHERETSASQAGASSAATSTADSKARTSTLGNPHRTNAPAAERPGDLSGMASGVSEMSASVSEGQGRLALSTLIARDLAQMGAREQRRRQMLTMLLLAHTLLALAIAVGYILPRPTPVAVGMTVAALVLYAVVALVNLGMRRLDSAIYLLVFGNAALVTALIAILAFAGQPFTVAQVALLYLAVVFEAGLLFTPEIVLILAGVTATLTAVALLFAISLAPPPSSGQTYLLVVFTLTLQALAGLLAWYTADFIAESIQETRRGSQNEYAQTRLNALLAQTQRAQQELDAQIATIQTAIGRALARETNVQVRFDSGRLSELAQSINLLLLRVDEGSRAHQEHDRMLAGTQAVAEQVGELLDPGAVVSKPRTPLTYTPIDNISIAVSQVQTQLHARRRHIQRLTSDAKGIASDSRDQLDGVRAATEEALKIVGGLLHVAEEFVLRVRGTHDLAARGRQALIGHIPPEVLAAQPATPHSTRDVAESVELSGLSADIFRPGETGEFAVAPDTDPNAPDITKLTRLMPALDAARPETSAQDAMNELWRLLGALDESAATDERAAASITHELGLLGGEMRQAASTVAWVRQALESLRRDAEQIEHINLTTEPLADPSPETSSAQESGARAPVRTRPLSEDQASAQEDGASDAADAPAAPGMMNAADLLTPLEDDASFPGAGGMGTD